MLKVRRPRSFLAPSGNSTLGFGLPAAIGAKCAKPDRPVVCLTGDGGFLLTCQELLTAVEERIPVVVVIIDDGGYSAIREYQRKGYGGRFIGVDFGAKPDYVALAQSMGADGIRVERPDEIQPAIREALSSSRPSIIDIPISRAENALPKFFTETYKRG
jgi:acetolactate synthase-1/2/3 large subunit